MQHDTSLQPVASTSVNSRIAKYQIILANAAGNVSPETKDKMIRVAASVTKDDDFSDCIMTALRATELSLFKREEDRKIHARAVFEIEVRDDMLNAHRMVHGGCLAYLVDICSGFLLILHGVGTDGPLDLVAQAISVIYHGNAPLGSKLKIINETVASGSRVCTAKTEIWNMSKGKLCVTGTATKMVPGNPLITKL